MISLAEWRVVRGKYQEVAAKENRERMDLGIGTLPLNIAVNDLILRDLLSKVSELESRLPKAK